MTPAGRTFSRTPDSARCLRARPLLGTIVEIAAEGRHASGAVERAFEAVSEVHRLMSYHDPASDVSRINRDAASSEVEVSAHTWQVLRAAHTLAEASHGLFDITVAPTLAALGFLPRHAGCPRASRHGTWRHVELRPGFAVRLARRVRIDLGGIAKGYAVDRAIEVLEREGMRAALVNAGGDLRVLGAEPRTLSVRRPGNSTELWPIVKLDTGAAATSADYYTRRRVRGRWVTPLIHPHTQTSGPRGRSVTVLAANCLTADALTKVVHADPRRATGVLASLSARALMLEESAGMCRLSTFDTSEGIRWQVSRLRVGVPPHEDCAS